MQAIEYTTRISPAGQFPVPPEILKKTYLKRNSKVRVMLLFEDKKGKQELSRFCGKWQDDRDADEIINDIYEDRQQNFRSERVEL